MRLADFIDSCLNEILAEYDACAVPRLHGAVPFDGRTRSDHVAPLLRAIANDMRQSEQAAVHDARLHGASRAREGFSIAQLVSEYAALRASVLRRWGNTGSSLSAATAADDITRFNQAVDGAIAESADIFNQEFTHDRSAREAVDRELMLNRGRLEYASRLSNVGFWYCDLPFDVLEWDDRVKEHFFFAPSVAVTIADFYDRIHPEDRERTRSAIDASISSREAYDIIYRTMHPLTGEVKWIRALGGTDYASDGSPIHFDGLTVDVTAQQLAEQRIAESEARHRGVITNMDESFTLFDPDFNIIEVNDAACQLVGIERAQFVGANHWQLFPGTYESELGQMYRQVLLDGQPQFLEHCYVFADGHAVWFEVRAFKVGAGVAALFRDVTERITMIKTLKGADKRKDEFLAMLAHELRNPLAPIMTAGEILSRFSESSAPIAAATSVIRRQARHMTRLLDDLLDVARVTQGRIHLQKNAIAVDAVIAQAFEICEPQLQAKHQRLTMSIEKTAPLHVDGDMARLVQCVANILTNAIKYTDPHGEIAISVRSEEAIVLIEVTDTGSGIAPDLLPQVFELFVQSQRTLDRSQGGLGVGLAIVKRLIDMHGGQVRALSRGEGFGSTFEIRLPRILAPSVGAEQNAISTTTSGRILLVDDNVDAAESLAMLLEMQGHTLLAVHSAGAALDSIASFKPDVMLIDIGLPEMDGYELVQQLGALPLGRACRKIALTGYGQPEDRQRALDVGFDAHLVKPVDFDLLERAIAGLA